METKSVAAPKLLLLLYALLEGILAVSTKMSSIGIDKVYVYIFRVDKAFKLYSWSLA